MMHVQSSSSPAFYANIRAIRPDTLAISQIKPSQAELEEMLGNLRANPIIGSRISDNEDGTYSFDMTAGSWSEQAFTASAIVNELNGNGYEAGPSGPKIFPSQSDAKLFKQMTGYNLLVLGGQQVVLDAHGMSPALSDQRAVHQALEFVNNVAEFRASGYIEGELSSKNIGIFLSAYALTANSGEIVHQLMASLNSRLEEPAAVDDRRGGESSEIESLLHMISV
jgi:hypothetical protein